MTVSLFNLPHSLLAQIIETEFIDNGENNFNVCLCIQARQLKKLSLVCKQLNQLVKDYLAHMAKQYMDNIQNAKKYEKPLVGLHPNLIEATLKEDLERFDALLLVEDVNVTDSLGRTALHMAAALNEGRGNLQLIQKLLAHPQLDKTKRYKDKTAKELTKNEQIRALL